MINKELTVDEYIDDPVNTTMINERCIELAIVCVTWKKWGMTIL